MVVLPVPGNGKNANENCETVEIFLQENQFPVVRESEVTVSG
jgi:hypothetical protein